MAMTMKADFLNSRWMKLAKTKGAEKKVRKEFSGWLKNANNLQLVKRARQLFGFFQSPHVPKREKVIIIAALLYLISPVDLVPDWIPVAGWLDDLGVAGMVMNFVLDRVDKKDVRKDLKRAKKGKKVK